MDEFEWINKIKQDFYRHPTIQKGIGDDAAVFSQSHESLVTAVDMFIENIHFTRQTMSPWQIGYKSLAVNLSDMAAMGATPVYYLVAIAIPNSWTTKEIDKVFTGMMELANRFNIDLIGGDTVSGDCLTISITIFGRVQNDRVRYRHLARGNDIVFATGTLGDSSAGLYMLQNNKHMYNEQDYFIKRHQQPTARATFATALSDIPRIALNDISDGIANEATEIAEAANVSLHLRAESIPTKYELKQFTVEQRFKWTYFGGEDFELIGTVSKRDWSKVLKIANNTNTPVSEIGIVKLENPGKVFLHNREKSPIILKKEGYTHVT